MGINICVLVGWQHLCNLCIICVWIANIHFHIQTDMDGWHKYVSPLILNSSAHKIRLSLSSFYHHPSKVGRVTTRATSTRRRSVPRRVLLIEFKRGPRHIAFVKLKIFRRHRFLPSIYRRQGAIDQELHTEHISSNRFSPTPSSPNLPISPTSTSIYIYLLPSRTYHISTNRCDVL